MKGIILAGGTGSRLLPLTKVTNKHLLPVGREPMICHPVRKLVEAGINDILVVTGTEHMGAVVSMLGSGRLYGCRFTYRVQDEAGGIAQALALAEGFSQQMCVLLGDNIFQDSLSPLVASYRRQKCGAQPSSALELPAFGHRARVVLKEVSDPQRYGVAVLRDKYVVGIEEKPENPQSSFAVTGIYFYDWTVFNIIRTLKPSARGELEITDVNNEYIARGQLEYSVLDGWWTDAGTHESLRLANKLMGESQ